MIDPRLAEIVREVDQEEARIITGLTQVLSDMLAAKQAAAESARASLHQILNPHQPRAQTQQELDIEFRAMRSPPQH